MRELYPYVDVIHEKFCQKDGRTIKEMPAETKALVDQFRHIEYYRMHDALR